jgi:hypothetical protein
MRESVSLSRPTWWWFRRPYKRHEIAVPPWAVAVWLDGIDIP